MLWSLCRQRARKVMRVATQKRSKEPKRWVLRTPFSRDNSTFSILTFTPGEQTARTTVKLKKVILPGIWSDALQNPPSKWSRHMVRQMTRRYIQWWKVLFERCWWLGVWLDWITAKGTVFEVAKWAHLWQAKLNGPVAMPPGSVQANDGNTWRTSRQNGWSEEYVPHRTLTQLLQNWTFSQQKINYRE